MSLTARRVVALALLFCLLVPQFCLCDDSVAFVHLQHSTIAVRASSLSFSHVRSHGYSEDVADAITSASNAPLHELHSASDFIFHKAKFAIPGSFSLSDASMAAARRLAYSRHLGDQHGDEQFFVQFATPTDTLTLLAFHKFTGRSITAHVQSNLYIAIGDSAFPERARRFHGVLWVQAREASSKISVTLQMTLDGTHPTTEEVIALVAECWLDGCLSAATTLLPICPIVYLHPTLLEVVCRSSSLQTLVSVLSSHVAIDHIDVKHEVVPSNFGGRAILGAGPDALSPSASRVLSSISMSNSVIAVADSGLDINNCFFYDPNVNNITAPPFNRSRVLEFYEVQNCERCGKCCIPGISSPECSDSINTCGNYKDESAHGTHTCGTVAGQGPASVEYANGIANGSRIYFQDMENIVDNAKCYKTDSCGFGGFSDLTNLFAPALAAGAYVVHFISPSTLSELPCTGTCTPTAGVSPAGELLDSM
jgi:hypothetical protein